MLKQKEELLNSIIYIQYIFRKILKVVNDINTEVDFLYNCTNFMMDELLYNFKNTIIKYTKYNNDMQLLELILNKIKDIPRPFHIKLFNIKNKVLTSLYNIRIDIFYFIKRSGCLSLKYIILLLFNKKYKLCDKKIVEYLKFYNDTFKILSCDVYNLNKNNKNKLYIKIEDDMKNNESDINIVNNFKKDKNPVCINNNDNSRLYIYIYDYVLVMNGYFKEDPLNINRIDGFLKNKSVAIKNLLKNVKLCENFKNGYFDQIKLGDFVIYTPKEIIHRCNKAHLYLLELKSKTINSLLREFVTLDIDKQAHILSILLLSSNESQYVAYIIYDMISNDINLVKPQPLSEQIFNRLHWSIQKLFKNAIKKIDTYKYNLDNYDTDELSYDKRILLLKADDSIKKKALEKYSEISNNSSEHTHKPIQYLEGLLKIPFGIYKKETIIGFLNNFINEIVLFNNDLILHLNNSDDNINKHVLLSICDVFNKLNKKSKYSIDNYIKDIEENILYLYKIDITDKKYNFQVIDYKNICTLYNIKSSGTKAEYISTINDYVDKKDIIEKIDIYTNIKKLMNIKVDIHISLLTHFIDLVNKWKKYKIDKIQYLNNVDTILNKSVYGHSEAKLQIKRIIAQWINGENSGYCFGFEGPPGNGKTTLAKYGLSKCLIDEEGNSRPFGFIPIGGNSNGSSLEGHSYTYVGSTWGRIVDILMDSKCMNPIIFIDELDKISRTENGRELIGILTHLTDSTQNSEFYDKYFSGIKLDLSRALFIFSYNDPDLIDPILKDRITRIRTKCFNKHDKCIICREYLLPEILKVVGYNIGDITIEDEDIIFIIKNYTAEAGVRKLKEKLFELVRQINLDIIMGNSMLLPIKITREFIENVFSDRPKIEIKKILSISYIGIINGLYASQNGMGGITVIESFKTPSDIKLSLEITGQQGDVMKESIKCAKTLAWNLLPSPIKNKINKEWSDSGIYGVHVHCPEGSTPKDGPSAGTAITVSILSLLIGVPIYNTVAITGEIDLNGKVLAVGGLEHKVEGAKLAGITDLYCPLDNKDDIEKIRRSQFPPEDDGFRLIYIDTIYDVLEKVFDYNNNYNGIEKIVFNRLL